MIYLKGGYAVLYFKYGLTITRRKGTGIPVKTLVIKAMGNMAADNKIIVLHFENKSGVLLYTNYWLAGVDYEDKNSNESRYINYDKKIHIRMTSNKIREWMQKNYMKMQERKTNKKHHPKFLNEAE